MADMNSEAFKAAMAQISSMVDKALDKRLEDRLPKPAVVEPIAEVATPEAIEGGETGEEEMTDEEREALASHYASMKE